MTFKTTCTALAVTAVLTAGNALADWSLNSESSSLKFISIKNNTIAELHDFKQLSGRLSNNGEFEFKIPLVATDTYLEIRDERMRNYLFEVNQFPLAIGKGKLDMAPVNALSVGDIISVSAAVDIAMHGRSKTHTMTFRVAKLSDTKLWVVSDAPLLINAADYGFVPGIEKLQELAALQSIVHAVPVLANLVYERKAP